jgi:electron transfer flavoprotein alpha/beta subunit
MLFTAIAKGVDKATKLTDGNPADSHQLGKAFANVLGSAKYDLVFTGVQSVDDRDGQMGPHTGQLSQFALCQCGVRRFCFR